eukprot:Awhi_evm1s11891
MDAFYTQSFEMSLASKPLNFYFTTLTNFSTTIAGTSDVTVGSFRQDIKSILNCFRNQTSINDAKVDSFKFLHSGIEQYQLNLGSLNVPQHYVQNSLTPVYQQGEVLSLLTQTLSSLHDQNLGMNIKYQDFGDAIWALGLDLSRDNSAIGGLNSTLTLGSPLVLSLKGSNIANSKMDTFIQFGSVLTVNANREIVVSF